MLALSKARHVLVVLALALALLATVGSSPSSAIDTDSRAADHTQAYTRTFVIIRAYDAQGNLISKRVVNDSETQGATPSRSGPSKDCTFACHIIGCAATSCPDNAGSARVDVIQKGYDLLGSDLWKWDVWTEWSWNHRQCPCTVGFIDRGHKGTALDQFWQYDKMIALNAGYRDGAGGPHTYYHHKAQGQFSGPFVDGFTVYRRPTNILNSYNDGTFEWWKECC